MSGDGPVWDGSNQEVTQAAPRERGWTFGSPSHHRLPRVSGANRRRRPRATSAGRQLRTHAPPGTCAHAARAQTCADNSALHAPTPRRPPLQAAPPACRCGCCQRCPATAGDMGDGAAAAVAAGAAAAGSRRRPRACADAGTRHRQRHAGRARGAVGQWQPRIISRRRGGHHRRRPPRRHAARRMGADTARQSGPGLVPRALQAPGHARPRRPDGAVHRTCLQQPGGLPQRPVRPQRRPHEPDRHQQLQPPAAGGAARGFAAAGRQRAGHQGGWPSAGRGRLAPARRCAVGAAHRAAVRTGRPARAAHRAAGVGAAGRQRHAAADGRLHVRAGLHQPARKPPGLLRRAVGGVGAAGRAAVVAQRAGAEPRPRRA